MISFLCNCIEATFQDRTFEAGVGVLPSSLHEAVTSQMAAVCEEATLDLHAPTRRTRGGREGVHSTPMGYLLAEMQHIARSHPGATW